MLENWAQLSPKWSPVRNPEISIYLRVFQELFNINIYVFFLSQVYFTNTYLVVDLTASSRYLLHCLSVPNAYTWNIFLVWLSEGPYNHSFTMMATLNREFYLLFSCFLFTYSHLPHNWWHSIKVFNVFQINNLATFCKSIEPASCCNCYFFNYPYHTIHVNAS